MDRLDLRSLNETIKTNITNTMMRTEYFTSNRWNAQLVLISYYSSRRVKQPHQNAPNAPNAPNAQGKRTTRSKTEQNELTERNEDMTDTNTARITVANQKGGGKTTDVIHAGRALAARGHVSALVDIDYHGGLTCSLTATTSVLRH